MEGARAESSSSFSVEKRGSGMFNASFNISMSNIALTRGI